jgi:agmatine/peptidylarginine deiminase
MTSSRRLPAEWEDQAGTLLAWPHADSDWGPRLESAEADFVAIAAAIADHQPLVILVRDTAHRRRASRALAPVLNPSARVGYAVCPLDDTWIRDFGPLTVLADNEPLLLDFRFDGWGGKFTAGADDAATRRIHADGLFGDTPLEPVDMVLEGGAIESDGAGTLLTTAECWRARHPGLDRDALSECFHGWFGTWRCLWLTQGRMEGDDTDGHVDTLARFLAPDTIAYQACDDPADPHYAPLNRLAEELAAMRTPDGRPYRLVPLPWPGAVRDDDGRRLPATYANWLFVNGALLVPSYGVTNDQRALDVLAPELPDRRVVGVPCRELIWQNGSLHCATMQLPAGVDLRITTD